MMWYTYEHHLWSNYLGQGAIDLGSTSSQMAPSENEMVFQIFCQMSSILVFNVDG